MNQQNNQSYGSGTGFYNNASMRGANNSQQQFYGQQQQQRNMNMQQPRIDGQFLSSQNGGMIGNRSQPDLNLGGRRDGMRQNQRAMTPDMGQIQMFNNSSAQSGKNFNNQLFQTSHINPFALNQFDNRPPSGISSDMQFSSPDRNSQMQNQLGNQFRGMMQSSGYDTRFGGMTQFGRNNMMMSRQGFDQSYGQNNMMQSSQYNQDFYGMQQPMMNFQQGAITFETVLNQISDQIRSSGNNANSFLKESDAYLDRQFESWELSSMFKLSNQQVRILLKRIDSQFNQRCTIKGLCEVLRQSGIQVDSLGFNGSSEYKDRFNKSALQTEFKSFARFLLSNQDLSPNTKSYQEVFTNILKFCKSSSHSNYIEIQQLKDFLGKQCSRSLNSVQQSKFLEYIQLSKRPEVTNVQFVHALRQIVIDYKQWDLEELLKYIKGVNREQTQLGDPLVEKVKHAIFQKELYNQINDKIKQAIVTKLKIGFKEQDPGETLIAPKSELISFIDSIPELKLSLKEKETLVSRYTVTPATIPQPAKPTNPLPASEPDKIQNIQAQESQNKPQQQQNESLDKSKLEGSKQLDTQGTNIQQESVAPAAQILNNVPSSDSFARDTLTDTRLNLPPLGEKLPVTQEKPLQEAVEDDFEEDDDWENDSRQPIEDKVDQLEGGQQEKATVVKEKIAGWISLKKFQQEMKPTAEMLDQVLYQARVLKFKVLDQMKSWIVLTGDSITNAFKLTDKKGTLIATKKQLIIFLSKIVGPQVQTELIDAIFKFFMRVNDQGQLCIEYMQFYNFFCNYANLSTVQQSDPQYNFLKELHKLNLQHEQEAGKQDKNYKRSLGKMMGITQGPKVSRDKPVLVEPGVFFQVYQKLRSQNVRQVVGQTQFPFEQEIRQLLKVAENENKINLVLFQELMGFKKEEDPSFQASNSLRALCIYLQLGGVTVQVLRQRAGKLTNVNRFLNEIFMYLQNQLQDVLHEPLNQSPIGFTLVNLANDYSVGTQINHQKFLGRIDFEMHKLISLEQFYIKLKQLVKQSQQDLQEIFGKFGADLDQREISRDNFLNMLRELHLIGENEQDESQYFIDEYDADESKVISLKHFEEDFEEFVGTTSSAESVLERVSDRILYMIMEVTTNGYQQTQEPKDIIKMLNLAFGEDQLESSKINCQWLHGYDFTRWFMKYISEPYYQNQSQELVDLFVQYYCANNENNGFKNMINFPILLRKIAVAYQVFDTPNLKRQLAIILLKAIQKRIVEELVKRSKRASDYFIGYTTSENEFQNKIAEIIKSWFGQTDIEEFNLSSLSEVADLYKEINSNQVNLEHFVQDLELIQNARVQKIQIYKNIQNQLDDKGQDIQIVIQMLKGNAKGGVCLSFDDFQALFQVQNVDIDVRTVLRPIFEQFDIDSHGEISAEQFIDDFNSTLKKKKQVTFEIGGKSALSATGLKTLQPQNKPIHARRNFQNFQQCLEGIAKVIEQRQMNDFGSFLKGYDFENSNHITVNQFFKVMTELFGEQILGRGDALDLISQMDREKVGKINIQLFADTLNRYIVNRNYWIVLKSQVSAVIDEVIVEKIDEENRNQQKVAPGVLKRVFLDLICGIQTHKQSNLQDWFQMYSRQEEGYLSLNEFIVAIEKLEVKATATQKRDLFNYLVSLEKTLEQNQDLLRNGLVQTISVVKIVDQEIPQQDLFSIAQRVLVQICISVAKNSLPVQDICEKFELTKGSSQITYLDFVNGVLSQELKLLNEISRNMIEIVHQYYNQYQEQSFSYVPFIRDLQLIATDRGLKVSLTQAELDNQGQYQTLNTTNQQTKIQMKVEPAYEVRSQKNTYFNGNRLAMTLQDNQCFKQCDDIIIRTRCLGLSVEQHFQNYGRITQLDGIRRLDIRDFREAVTALGVSWAQNNAVISNLYHQIENVAGQQQLTLDAIGGSIYFNSTVDMLSEEAKALEAIYDGIIKTGLLNNIQEVLNFYDFNKDGQLKVQEFVKMLYNHIGLKDHVTQDQIALLAQRYRVQSTGSVPLIYSLRFIEDLAYQHLSIGILDQWAAKIVETIEKLLQIRFVIDSGRQCLNDHDIHEELRAHFQRSCVSSRDTIFYDDLARVFSDLNIFDQSTGNVKTKAESFFKFCSQSTLADIRQFKPNQFDPLQLALPSQIKLNHFLSAIHLLERKPLNSLYQMVFLEVYYSSKLRKISVTGQEFIHLFKVEDQIQRGLVTIKVFCQKIQSQLLMSQSQIKEDDLIFLATKYARNTGQQVLVDFQQFLADYVETESKGVDSGFSLIFDPKLQQEFLQAQVKQQEVQALESSYKTLEKLNPDQRQIFQKMGKYLTQKELDELLCMELANKDMSRQGFVDQEAIKDVMRKINIPVSSNQLIQLTQVLSKDAQNYLSYLELISLLFGAKYANKVKDEYGIGLSKSSVPVKPLIDISKLSLTQSLVDQLELKLSQLNQLVQKASNGSQYIRDQEVFSLMKKADIIFDSKDLETIQTYLRAKRDPETYQVNFQLMLKHFRIGEDTSALLYQIQKQLQGKDINSLTSQAQIAFIDFRLMLQKANVALPKTGDTLERLFKQICEQRQEINRATLLRALQFQIQQETLRLPVAPAEVNEFIRVLVQQKIELAKEFTQFQNQKKIPITNFEKFCDKLQIKTGTKQVINKFFKTTDGSISLTKIAAYVKQTVEGPNINQKQPNKSTETLNLVRKVGELPQEVRYVLDKISSHMQEKRMEPSKLFELLDSNKNGFIEILEFEEFCQKEQLNQGLSLSSIENLFKYLDSTGDGAVSINEMCMLLKGCQLSLDEKMKSVFTKEFENELVKEIEMLFDKLDTDKNKWLTAQELVIVFKTGNSSSDLSLEQAKQVIQSIDKDSNGKINKKEFIDYVLPKQKKMLLQMDDALQDLRQIFSSLINVKSGFGVEQQINRDGLMEFMIKAGLEQVSDTEIQELFQQIDTNNSGMIDIDEIMDFIISNQNLNGRVGTTILMLRKKRAKVNQFDVFDLMRLLPPFMQPSPTQRFLEQMNDYRLSQKLKPNFDFSKLKFSQLSKVKERQIHGNKDFISLNKPNYALEFSINEIKGVPNTEQLYPDLSKAHIEVRCYIFDIAHKAICSSILIVPAKVLQQKQIKTQVSSNWQVSDSVKNICLRSDENWHLVIELVGYDQNDKSRQITVGWTSAPFSTKPGKVKLPLRGGSPFNDVSPDILTSENEVKHTTGLLRMFSSNKPPVVDRSITLEIKPFFRMDINTQADLSQLPENTICFKNLITLAVQYQNYCYQKLIKDEILLQKPKGDLVLSSFCKIFDCTDLQIALSEFWPEILLTDKDPLQVFQQTIKSLYAAMNDKSYGFDNIYPTRSSTGQILLDRQNLVRQNLLLEKAAEKPKTIGVNTIDFVDDYQPFSMRELDVDLV